ncbi:MAG: hypothetical protein KGL39_07660 [Patescibacteria group bacterium]|nr:hypothetical protein [Patescibacteria group bacterium]
MPAGNVFLPEDDRTELLARCKQLIEACKVSQGQRAALARQQFAITETGKGDGSRSRINLLYGFLDNLASHLFSPTALKFAVGFQKLYPKNILQRGVEAARILSDDWEQTNTDLLFGQGVFEALRYGTCILKQWAQEEGEDRHAAYHSALVMPWNFGVTNEKDNSLDRQDAMCETVILTLPEVWRRIYHLPNAEQLFRKIQAQSKRGESGDDNNSFFHPVWSTSQISTGIDSMTRPIPGGIVALSNNPNYSIIGPTLGVDVVKMYELWIRNGADYACVQIIEPDIMISPTQYTRLSNLLISGAEHTNLHPYTRICANETPGWFWGRSELTDLIEPQNLVSTWADDATRLLGLQTDKILAFIGDDGLNDEAYDAFRAAGYRSMPQGASVTDITPHFPPEMLPMLQFAMGLVNRVGGFDNILGGQGQPGVRSSEQGEMLKQLASPRLLDRSLLLERQCAQAADLRLSLREAKDADHYWTDGTTEKTIEETRFTLKELPTDRRVTVDSHSGSPIFRNRHEQLLAFMLKAGILDGPEFIELSEVQHKDILVQRLKDRMAEQSAFMKQLAQQQPEVFAKLIENQGSRKR